jgi:hypothetical protein
VPACSHGEAAGRSRPGPAGSQPETPGNLNVAIRVRPVGPDGCSHGPVTATGNRDNKEIISIIIIMSGPLASCGNLNHVRTGELPAISW